MKVKYEDGLLCTAFLLKEGKDPDVDKEDLVECRLTNKDNIIYLCKEGYKEKAFIPDIFDYFVSIGYVTVK